jgi:hypothetical protein
LVDEISPKEETMKPGKQFGLFFQNEEISP